MKPKEIVPYIEDFKNIACGIDGSEESYRALKMAAHLTNIFQAKLWIIHVVPIPTELIALGASITEIEALLREKSSPKIKKAEKYASTLAINYTSAILQGDPADEIIAFCMSKKVDLLVIGYQGRGKIAKFLMGSVGNKILNLAQIPLLIVK